MNIFEFYHIETLTKTTIHFIGDMLMTIILWAGTTSQFREIKTRVFLDFNIRIKKKTFEIYRKPTHADISVHNDLFTHKI